MVVEVTADGKAGSWITRVTKSFIHTGWEICRVLRLRTWDWKMREGKAEVVPWVDGEVVGIDGTGEVKQPGPNWSK